MKQLPVLLRAFEDFRDIVRLLEFGNMSRKMIIELGKEDVANTEAALAKIEKEYCDG